MAENPESPVFACANFALLRAPVHPTERVADIRLPPAEDFDDEAERLTAYLSEAAGDHLTREALAVSSPSLAGFLDGLLSGRPARPADLHRAVRAVTAYRLRMATRPTPFGLMAGVTAADFVADPADAKVRFGRQHQRRARVDRGWLMSLVVDWELRPQVLRALRVTVNNLCFGRGGRLVLPYVPGREAYSQRPGAVIREATIRHTAAVREVLRFARRPMRYEAVERHLAELFPQASEQAISGMLTQLVAKDFLLTDLRPPMEAVDPLGHVLDVLAGLPPAAIPELARLREIGRALADYAATPLGAGLECWEAVTGQLRRLRSNDRPVHVDLALDVEARLPAAVAQEAERALTVLWQVAPSSAAGDPLATYHAEFVERYGLGRAVGVRELLDSDTGLGAPAGYQVPPSRRRPPPPGEQDSARDQLLIGLAQDALLGGEREVRLTEELIAQLSHDGSGVPPASTELFAQLLAESPAALQSGDFQLAVVGGSPAAGATFGRFADLLPERVRTGLAGLVGTEPPDTLAAQLVFQPLSARSGNVTQVPQWLARRLPVAAFADRESADTLDLDDLVVCADADRLFVVECNSGREVVPTVFHMLNTRDQAPNVARFLSEISRSGGRDWRLWRWGTAEALPYLPRVRYGRTILVPARWRPSRAVRDQCSPLVEWTAEVTTWRARWQVPDRVCLARSDHRIDLDLTEPLHLIVLRHELGQHADAVLQEIPGDELGNGWLTGPGGRYRSELVFPLTTARPAPARPVRPIRRRPRCAEHLPGGQWLYACVYCPPGRQTEVLTGYLPQLLAELPDEVDRWFFLRYRDTEDHLRLRFHGAPHALGAELLPRLHDWAAELRAQGVSSRLVLDTYDPELERYGGPEAIAAAERAFHADSVAVLDELQVLESGVLSVDPALLAAAGYVDLARAFMSEQPHDGEPPWVEWLLGNITKGAEHTEFQRRRREAVPLIDPYGTWSALRARPGGAAVLGAWQRRSQAISAYARTLQDLDARAWQPQLPILPSLFHMHHNRLVGADRQAELSSYAIARGAVQAHRDRRRNTQ
ncbi:lantibiotic dehydratase [Kitasatospora brasiliensis]|uniref:lantibiotic dehydratase n=1 Tax=Kitasatospora brasiliensis TaxID=3058040 RepID=UPI00292E9364|nr:lantibiotic dehydratase [Kitasatospora sp. K002]